MTGPRPSCTRCARAGSRCPRTESIVPADVGAAPTAAPADAPSAAPTESAPPAGAAMAPGDAAPVEAAESAEPEVRSAADLAARLASEAATVKSEVDEIELLINQAKTEAARHETRRSAAAEKLAIAADRLAVGGATGAKELGDLANQLVTVARKAALMEAQIDLLDGKRKSAVRLAELLDAKAGQAKRVAGMPSSVAADPPDGTDGGDGST